MKVIRIIHKAMRPTDEGRLGSLVHGLHQRAVQVQGLVFCSFEESRAVKEGQLLDIEKVRLRSYRMGSEG